MSGSSGIGICFASGTFRRDQLVKESAMIKTSTTRSSALWSVSFSGLHYGAVISRQFLLPVRVVCHFPPGSVVPVALPIKLYSRIYFLREGRHRMYLLAVQYTQWYQGLAADSSVTEAMPDTSAGGYDRGEIRWHRWRFRRAKKTVASINLLKSTSAWMRQPSPSFSSCLFI